MQSTPPLIGGGQHSGPDGVLVPGVGRKFDGPAKRIRSMALLKKLPCSVRAAVIDVQGIAVFLNEPLCLAGGQNIGKGIHRAGEGRFLIVAGHNQGQKGSGTGHGVSPCGMRYPRRAVYLAVCMTKRCQTTGPPSAMPIYATSPRSVRPGICRAVLPSAATRADACA